MTRITAQAIRLQRFTRPLLVLLASVIVGLPCSAAPVQAPATQSYVADFDRLLELMKHDDIYLADSGCDIGLLRATLRPAALAATTGKEVMPVLERAVECLHDNHATFNANIAASPRLVPSGLQVWAQWQDGHARVTQVRHATAAWTAGIRRGDIIVAIDSVAVADAIEHRLPCCVRGDGALEHARQWALLALLAGRHDQAINLTVSRSGTARQVSFDPRIAEAAGNDGLQNVAWKRLPDGTGYIAINNLGDTATVAAFDAALLALRDTSALFLDLRNTPGGGNTEVAEPIMGRLIDHRQPYQRIEPMHARPWLRNVAPRGPWRYTQPVTVLVSRWTGSMGEGMAIGLDGMGRARVCGSRMAGLHGSVFEHALPVWDLSVRLPAERLSHLDGTPREAFVPSLLVEDAEAEDAADASSWISSSIAACRQRAASTAGTRP